MSKDAVVFWEEAKKSIALMLDKSDYDLWVSRVEYVDFDSQNHLFTLSVPSNFIRNSCMAFIDTFCNALSEVFGERVKVDLTVAENKAKEEIEQPKPSKNVEDIQITNTPDKKIIVTESKITHRIYNPRDYSFDSFIISHSNEYAATTARAVAENPGDLYNPYFIWGDSGLGKTHLLRAIERFDKQFFPDKKVLYLTAEEFLNDFTNSIRTKTQPQFRIKYRELDVLLIDDVQTLSNKDETQFELFNTFNKLYENRKQMVFSCDQPIEKVKNMEKRLVTRFSSGLTVALQAPEFELRVAILKNWAEGCDLTINNDALEYIAVNVTDSVRDLQGVFTTVMSRASIQKIKVITKDNVREWLKDKIREANVGAPVSVDMIIMIVAKYYHLKSQEITGVKRTKSVAFARHVAMYLSCKLTSLSYGQVGAYFGNKEHASVIHANSRITQLLDDNDEKTRSDIDNLMREIQR